MRTRGGQEAWAHCPSAVRRLASSCCPALLVHSLPSPPLPLSLFLVGEQGDMTQIETLHAAVPFGFARRLPRTSSPGTSRSNCNRYLAPAIRPCTIRGGLSAQHNNMSLWVAPGKTQLNAVAVTATIACVPSSVAHRRWHICVGGSSDVGRPKRRWRRPSALAQCRALPQVPPRPLTCSGATARSNRAHNARPDNATAAGQSRRS